MKIINNNKNSVAGTETTVVAIRHLILALLTTPRVYRKLQAEIDAYYSNSSSQTNPSPNPNSKDTKTKTKTIPYADTKSLPYLQASIRESLRLWPPSASMLSKEVPPPSKSPSPTSSTLNQIEYKLHGYTLPPGTAIGQHLYAVGRHRGTWGGDAEVFRPERWFEASLEEETKEGKEGVGGVGGGVDGGWEKRKLKEMQAANDIVFSSGKYLCLGKSIALMEIGKFFCEVCVFYIPLSLFSFLISHLSFSFLSLCLSFHLFSLSSSFSFLFSSFYHLSFSISSSVCFCSSYPFLISSTCPRPLPPRPPICHTLSPVLKILFWIPSSHPPTPSFFPFTLSSILFFFF